MHNVEETATAPVASHALTANGTAPSAVLMSVIIAAHADYCSLSAMHTVAVLASVLYHVKLDASQSNNFSFSIFLLVVGLAKCTMKVKALCRFQIQCLIALQVSGVLPKWLAMHQIQLLVSVSCLHFE